MLSWIPSEEDTGIYITCLVAMDMLSTPSTPHCVTVIISADDTEVCLSVLYNKNETADHPNLSTIRLVLFVLLYLAKLANDGYFANISLPQIL